MFLFVQLFCILSKEDRWKKKIYISSKKETNRNKYEKHKIRMYEKRETSL